MIKAVIFDLYETLITEWVSEKYTSRKCAADLTINYELFREVWESLHHKMYIGSCSYEDALEIVCKKAGVEISPEKLSFCREQRDIGKKQCFVYRHDEILQMLGALRKRGYKLAVCSNCYSEEAGAFRKSEMVRLFHTVILSYEVGYAKPDAEIFRLCTEGLGVLPQECLYIGDGGSRELYGAAAAGMTPLRALWFIQKYANNIEEMPFEALRSPNEVMQRVSSL